MGDNLRLNTTVTVRKGWNSNDLQAYDLGELSIEELSGRLAQLVNEESLVVQIQLWNQEKLARIQAEYIRS